MVLEMTVQGPMVLFGFGLQLGCWVAVVEHPAYIVGLHEVKGRLGPSPF